MKYKKPYEELLDKYNALERVYKMSQDKIINLEGQIKGTNEAMGLFEGRERNLVVENEWLKDTIRLIVVPAGKELEIAKLVEKERERKTY